MDVVINIKTFKRLKNLNENQVNHKTAKLLNQELKQSQIEYIDQWKMFSSVSIFKHFKRIISIYRYCIWIDLDCLKACWDLPVILQYLAICKCHPFWDSPGHLFIRRKLLITSETFTRDLVLILICQLAAVWVK